MHLPGPCWCTARGRAISSQKIFGNKWIKEQDQGQPGHQDHEWCCEDLKIHVSPTHGGRAVAQVERQWPIPYAGFQPPGRGEQEGVCSYKPWSLYIFNTLVMGTASSSRELHERMKIILKSLGWVRNWASSSLRRYRSSSSSELCFAFISTRHWFYECKSTLRRMSKQNDWSIKRAERGGTAQVHYTDKIGNTVQMDRRVSSKLKQEKKLRAETVLINWDPNIQTRVFRSWPWGCSIQHNSRLFRLHGPVREKYLVEACIRHKQGTH